MMDFIRIGYRDSTIAIKFHQVQSLLMAVKIKQKYTKIAFSLKIFGLKLI